MATMKKPTVKKGPPKTPRVTKPAGVQMAPEPYYSARGDMHTLKEAEQIRSDPKRHAAAVNHAKSEVGALQKVARKKV